MKIRIKILFYLLFSSLTVFAQKNSLKDEIKQANDYQQLRSAQEKLVSLQFQLHETTDKAISISEKIKTERNNAQAQILHYDLTSLENQKVYLKHQMDSIRFSSKGEAVAPFIDTIFYLYSRSGSAIPSERTSDIEDRIRVISKQNIFDKSLLNVKNIGGSVDIVYNDIIIMSINQYDALWMDSDIEVLANIYKDKIITTIENEKQSRTIDEIAKDVAVAIVVIIILYVIIILVKKAFIWIDDKTHSHGVAFVRKYRLNRYLFIDDQTIVTALYSVISIMKWFTILFIVYLVLPILFSVLPWTQAFADKIWTYVYNPIIRIAVSVWNYLPNLFTIIVIVTIFRYLLRFLKFLKNQVETEKLVFNGFYTDWATPTYQIIKFLIISFMFVVIFPYLPGSESPIFQGVSVFLGFLFTFGSAGSLSNIISGLVLTYMRLFKLGDRVQIGDVIGDVVEKTMLVTRIRTHKNEIVSIPNSTVMSSYTINYSSDALERGLILHTGVTIGYDAPWKDVHNALLEAADRTNYLLKEPKPFVLQLSLEDFYVSYQLNAYSHRSNQLDEIYSELHQNIQDVFNEKGIEIMSPHYSSHRDGNKTTIPADYLDKNYSAPKFGIDIINFLNKKNNETK